MRVKAYPLVTRCVEDGVAYGWNRAHKHAVKPSGDTIKAAIEDAVMNELSQWFDFGGEPK